MKVCPQCEKRFPNDYRLCPFDEEKLEITKTLGGGQWIVEGKRQLVGDREVENRVFKERMTDSGFATGRTFELSGT